MSSTSALSDSPSPQSAPTVGATSDSGLAEWTTRIKEMQRQVDADEEAEQRRLEEEIVRTRLARQRRLRSGQSGDFGIGMRGIDIKSPTAAVRSVESDESNSCTREKLTPPITFSKPITKAATASGVKRAPISLAEFMGGSASGPRLKRHEPQIDPSRAYDGRMEHGSVHPIFGRGGVAMPGMVGQGGEGAPARSAATVVAAALSTNSPVSSNGPLATDQPRRRTTSTLSAALRYAEKLNEQAPPRAQTPRLSGLGIRERRTSTPGGSSSSENKVNASPTAFSPRSENFTGNTVKSDISANPPAIHSATGPLPKVLVSHTIEPRSDVFVSDVRNRDPISEARLKTLPDNAQVGTLTQIVSSPYMNSPSTAPTSDLTTVSIEVMSILHEKVTLIPCDTSILYDTELLVIVHRVRTHKSGLVTTKVWCWQGRKSRCGEREEGKVGKLAARYGTSPEYVRQQSEPPEFIHALGGKLATRQGSRAHWSSENTTMHVIRSNNKQILIDELDLVRPITTIYPCFSLHLFPFVENKESLLWVQLLRHHHGQCLRVVWYRLGTCGTLSGIGVRKSLATGVTTVVELTEGENDGNDDLFWMIMGDSESYAKADYWKWRQGSIPSEPRCWLVEFSNAGAPVRPVPVLSAETISQESTYVIDCGWEFFVVVGKRARGKRADITLADLGTITDHVETCGRIQAALANRTRSYITDTLPLDMRLAFRNLDELALNDGLIPDYMNILSVKEAVEHKLEWGKSALSDQTMLPLGLDTSHVPLL
ncbi:hypothetical protein EV401DRAFT_2203316 [Pisolithus croceorrhizus]|nr:hypothetical protein EV401DRAFT_2203316 [Pisolithus croceorrhizus]